MPARLKIQAEDQKVHPDPDHCRHRRPFVAGLGAGLRRPQERHKAAPTSGQVKRMVSLASPSRTICTPPDYPIHCSR